MRAAWSAVWLALVTGCTTMKSASPTQLPASFTAPARAQIERRFDLSFDTLRFPHEHAASIAAVAAELAREVAR